MGVGCWLEWIGLGIFDLVSWTCVVLSSAAIWRFFSIHLISHLGSIGMDHESLLHG